LEETEESIGLGEVSKAHLLTGPTDTEAAVRTGLTLVWSNAQVDGQVNRLKLIKRAMYGRGNFDLLRLRVLHAA